MVAESPFLWHCNLFRHLPGFKAQGCLAGGEKTLVLHRDVGTRGNAGIGTGTGTRTRCLFPRPFLGDLTLSPED